MYNCLQTWKVTHWPLLQQESSLDLLSLHYALPATLHILLDMLVQTSECASNMYTINSLHLSIIALSNNIVIQITPPPPKRRPLDEADINMPAVC